MHDLFLFVEFLSGWSGRCTAEAVYSLHAVLGCGRVMAAAVLHCMHCSLHFSISLTQLLLKALLPPASV